jgi:putative DeoR family transcriptional regulator (stage III sporulation protein D)
MKSYRNKKYIESRVLEVAEYTLKTKSDIRRSAKKFGVSKSTVHKDLSVRLLEIDSKLYSQVGIVLIENKHIGQLLGGESTRKKYYKGVI